MKYMVIVEDTFALNYEFYRILEVGLSKEEAEIKCKDMNCSTSPLSPANYLVATMDWIHPMESMYDLADEIPTYEQACKLFGIDLLGEEKAKELYNNKFKK